MNWLDNLARDHSLKDVSEDCIQYVMESYYLIKEYQMSDGDSRD